jgi:N-acetylneuraminic acid mutarotase
MPYAARELTSAALPNGFIFIAGGTDGTAKNLSHWYDPYNNVWLAKSNLPGAWWDGRVGHLPDGRIIIFGGSIGSSTRATSTYVYDPEADTYTLTGSLPQAVGNHVSVTLADGRILSLAGVSGSIEPAVIKTQIFDPATMSWSLGSDQPVAHGNYPGAVATPCGPAYLWGGNMATKRVSAYDPSTDTWSVMDDLPFTASHGSYGRFYDGQYIWAGGFAPSETAKTYLSATPIVE